MGYYDELFPGEDWSTGEKAQRAKSRSRGRKPRQVSSAPAPATATRSTQPDWSDDVPQFVRELAQYWVQYGLDVDLKPRVNVVNFAEKLQKRILDDKVCRKARAHGEEILDDILRRAIRMFWEDTEIGERGSIHQFRFLDDEWDWLLDRAASSWTVSEMKKRGLRTIEYSSPRQGDPKTLRLYAARKRVTEETAFRAVVEKSRENTHPIKERRPPGELASEWAQARERKKEG
jgi:hypothetical protein